MDWRVSGVALDISGSITGGDPVEPGEGVSDWLDQAGMNLLVAGDLIKGGNPEEAITSSFMAMVYAARAALVGRGFELSDLTDVVRVFQEEALPVLGLSKENQRALIIVADLYTKVVHTREMQADPVTATACVDDARAFVKEIKEKMACE
jgi:uncharacterized protein (UPF0332 family)